MYELNQGNNLKLEELQLKHDADMKKMGQRLKEDLASRNEKIKDMER